MNKYYALDLESFDSEYLKNATFYPFHPGIILEDSPENALTWRVLDGSKLEKIESNNLPKVLRTPSLVHLVEGYYRVETSIRQVTGENKIFIRHYAVCEW